MVLPSIEPLKTFGTGGLTPARRLSSWAATATESAYSALAVNINFFFQFTNMFH